MGGMGSGRQWYLGAKDTTDDYRSIDVRRWKRDGLLVPDQVFGWQWSRHNKVVASIRVVTQSDRLILIYRHRAQGKDWTDESYPVYLDWTDCNMGGQRPWFVCPAKGCGKRVAILYGGGIFACRKCHQLNYPSQREDLDDRACRRADKIRDKLGWEPGILNGYGMKPKGMHMSTFLKLCKQHNAFVEISLREMNKRFRLLGESIDDWM
jgi:Zn-finger protein